jgi:hypothetical protein
MGKHATRVDSGGEVEGQRPGVEGIKEKRRRQNREKTKRGDGEGLRRRRGGIGSDGTEAGMRKRGGSEEPEGRKEEEMKRQRGESRKRGGREEEEKMQTEGEETRRGREAVGATGCPASAVSIGPLT